MATPSKRPNIRNNFKIPRAIAAIAIALAISLWLFALPFAEVKAQTPDGPSVSRSSPSDYILDRRPGNTQQFTVSATAGDNSINSWEWFVDFVSQGGQSLALTETIDRTFSYTFSTSKLYRVRVDFTDTADRSGSASWLVSVSSQPIQDPSVTNSSPSSPVSLTTGDSQTFSVSATDPNNDIAELYWLVNDEEEGGGPVSPTTGSISRTFSYTFSSAGIYTVEAEILDDLLQKDSAIWTVNVSDSPPVNSAPTVTRDSPSSPVSLTTGDTQTFEATATDADNNITQWEWSVGLRHTGGRLLLPSGSVTRSFSHTFPSAGTHTVEAEFTDEDGESGSVSWTVNVSGSTVNSTPVAYKSQPDADSLSAYTGDSIEFVVECYDVDFGSGRGLVREDWSVNGGVVESDEFSSPRGATFDRHTVDFPTVGRHTVTYTCYDELGASGSVSWTVTVNEIPPGRTLVASRISPSSSVSLTVGDSQEFWSQARDSDGNLTKWDWFLDNVRQGGFTFSPRSSHRQGFRHNFSEVGSHTVRSTFTDADGESASVSWVVAVAAVPRESRGCVQDLGTLTGEITRSGEWTGDCVKEGSFSRFYSFTLEDETAVTISLESSEDTYLYLLEGVGTSGRVLTQNDDMDPGSGNTNSGFTTGALSAGTYTVEATTFNGSVTGSFILTIGPADTTTVPSIDGCFQDLGTLTSGVTRTGQWTGDCASTHEEGSYARFYSFTLGEETEVTISLESSEDTYLYLLRGADSGGSVVDDNDDVESGNTNSEITRTLGAGTYTVEATTYDEEETGSFTLTLSGPGGTTPTTEDCLQTVSVGGSVSSQWVSGCESEAQSGSYARFYTFTLDQRGEATITLESDDADTYLYLRSGNSTSGSYIDRNDDYEGSTSKSQIQETLDAGTYTVEATTYDEEETGSFTLTLSGPGGTTPTTEDCLQTVSVGGSVTGQWVSRCESEAQSGSYARFYTFTLDQRGEATITLESDDADTYLYLRSGNSTSGSYIDRNDDYEGSTSKSQIQETLDAGTYTVEATTYDEEETGSFTLTLSGPGGTTPTTEDCLQTVSVGGSVSSQWVSGCESEAQSGSYARFYTFTLDQRGEATITLESDDADTYLYLRSGNSTSGSYIDRNDDYEGSTSKSQIQETLDAGTYTVEATTYDEEETGSFTLTISPADTTTVPSTEGCFQDLGTLSGEVTRSGSWTGDCASIHQEGKYARFYSFTLSEETEVGITLTSSEDTYLSLLQGADSGGRVLAFNDDANNTKIRVRAFFGLIGITLALGDTDSAIIRTLPAGTYTVEATTFGSGTTGSFTLTIGPAATTTGGCLEELGTLSGELTRSGSWTGLCASTNQFSSFARFYSFTLEREREVVISLESSEDTYLYLLRGADSGGDVAARNDDVGDVVKDGGSHSDTGFRSFLLFLGIETGDTDSAIVRTLGPGTYTIEATTFNSRQTGAFDLTVKEQSPLAIPEIVDVQVGVGSARIDPDAIPFVGQNLKVEFQVRNAGEETLSVYGEDAAGQVFLTSPGEVQELPRLQSQVPRGFNHWGPGVVYDTRPVIQLFREVGAPIDTIHVPLERSGRQTVRLELVFWDGDGNEIGRDVVERGISVAESPVIPPSQVVVDGVIYSVEGSVGTGGGVQYNVRRPGGTTPDPLTKDKAVFTAQIQQEFRAPDHWTLRLVEYLGGFTEDSLPYLGASFFLYENVNSILVVVFHPSPAARANALTAIAGSVLKEFILRASNHPEAITSRVALEVTEQAKELRAEAVSVREETRSGVPLSFDEAIKASNNFHYHEAYWQPAGQAVAILAAPDYFVDGDVADHVARSSVPVLEHFAGTDFLDGTLSIIEAVAVLGELGLALEEFEPWRDMKRGVQENLRRQRLEYAEFLDRLGIRDHSPFQLPALDELEIPLYTTLSGTTTPSESGDCFQSLGTFTGAVIRTGEWTGDCASTNQSGSYARFYSFTLDEETEVTISLESSVDTYLYLLRGADSGGSVVDDNDDVESGNRNSGLTLTLAAGTYTVEATTYDEEETGSFTLTIGPADTTPTPTPSGDCFQNLGTLTGEVTRSGEWTGDCASTNQSGSYARFYSFTLDEETEVEISLESSEDPVLYLLRGADSGGSVVDDNDDVESGNRNSGLTLTLAADTYTVEATTYDEEETGSFTLTIGPADSTPTPSESGACFQSLGTLPGEVTRTGQWASDCASTHRDDRYARFYAFTLDEETEVQISLESSVDTYLYLLRGADSGGRAVDDNDDVESGNTNSAIIRTLGAGTYTVEATTYSSEATGSFTLSISPAGSTTTPPSGSAPDLEVYSPSVFDKVFDPGERFSMSFWVRNLGGGASSSAGLRYFRSTDSTISTNDTELTIRNGITGIGPLGASESRLVTINLDAHTSGVYYYGACVETVAGETNTQNNCAAVFKVSLSAS